MPLPKQKKELDEIKKYRMVCYPPTPTLKIRARNYIKLTGIPSESSLIAMALTEFLNRYEPSIINLAFRGKDYE